MFDQMIKFDQMLMFDQIIKFDQILNFSQIINFDQVLKFGYFSGKAACEFPGEPVQGHVVPTKFHYEIHEQVRVICNRSYRLLGPPILTCQPDGHWSAPMPHCRHKLTSGT